MNTGVFESWERRDYNIDQLLLRLDPQYALAFVHLPKNSDVFSSLLLGRDVDDERDVASGVF